MCIRRVYLSRLHPSFKSIPAFTAAYGTIEAQAKTSHPWVIPCLLLKHTSTGFLYRALPLHFSSVSRAIRFRGSGP